MSRKPRKTPPLAVVGDALDEAAREKLEGDPDATGKAKGIRAAMEINGDDLERMVQIREAIKQELNALVDERFARIFKSFASAYQAFCEDQPDSERKWKYPVGMKVTLTPMGDSIGVLASCGYSVRRTHVGGGRMVQMDLPMQVAK